MSGIGSAADTFIKLLQVSIGTPMLWVLKEESLR